MKGLSMKTVVLATNNAHKVSEITHALDFPGWEFKTLREMGVDSDPAEDADTFLGNARIKALAAHEACNGMAASACNIHHNERDPDIRRKR